MKTKFNLQNKPVRKWLGSYGLKYSFKTGGYFYDKGTNNINDLKITLVTPAQFMNVFHNCEKKCQTIMFL